MMTERDYRQEAAATFNKWGDTCPWLRLSQQYGLPYEEVLALAWSIREGGPILSEWKDGYPPKEVYREAAKISFRYMMIRKGIVEMGKP